MPYILFMAFWFDLVVSNTHIFAEICVCDHYLFRLVWVYIIVYWVWVETVIRTRLRIATLISLAIYDH